MLLLFVSFSRKGIFPFILILSVNGVRLGLFHNWFLSVNEEEDDDDVDDEEEEEAE